MRYYDLTITPAGGGAAIREWTSHPQGLSSAPDPGALNIEFDLIISMYAQASGGGGTGDYSNSFVRVWGIPLADIAQSMNLSAPDGSAGTYKAVLKGGMGKGLPLANPAQAGTIVEGFIWRAVGNWIGTNMTLDLLLSTPVAPTGATYGNDSNTVPAGPVNAFAFYCPAGQPFSYAIKSALATALPGVPVTILVSSSLVAQNTEIGAYTTLQAFAEFLRARSLAILGPNNPTYTGVNIGNFGAGLLVWDNTNGTGTAATGGTASYAPKTVNIAFTDLIGQPTWVDNNVIQVTTVMRGDIQMGNFITLPPTITTLSAQGAINSSPTQFLPSRFSSQFQGSWYVTDVRQVGNYKQPSADSWVTVLKAYNRYGPNVGNASSQASSAAGGVTPL